MGTKSLHFVKLCLVVHHAKAQVLTLKWLQITARTNFIQDEKNFDALFTSVRLNDEFVKQLNYSNMERIRRSK